MAFSEFELSELLLFYESSEARCIAGVCFHADDAIL